MTENETETTESQKKYEELFAHRFSSEDNEYQQYVSRPPDPPPMVEDWRSRGGGNRGRDNRYQDRRGGHGWGGGRGWGGDRGWRGDNRRQHHWQDRDRDRGQDRDRDRDRFQDRDRDRDQGRDRDRQWGHGSGYQSGPPSSNQTSNSHQQRPHYDRY
ncbi:RNA guanine-N7 methyltransferase activating subunit-like [Notolabrus celidotus]|uniref:RNA guanine-N7 methyltransferase activating subunit-like n=1 Tax=Notolabrus celidotus TaxID=1203425 RepID=UPI00148F5C04|nr:RNA guanine-N7 methyltransferase activating subunit-like [Notolabrus celidotus]XP_034535583.1 RNA guanine-N7 methyltransferase activating subunit-like [Notolabrus celidotus]